MEAADSAKGTLVTGVEADETVEVAPCIMGTFIQASRQETGDGGDGWGGGEEECYGYHGKM